VCIANSYDAHHLDNEKKPIKLKKDEDSELVIVQVKRATSELDTKHEVKVDGSEDNKFPNLNAFLKHGVLEDKVSWSMFRIMHFVTVIPGAR
jgi:hypothetical protein